MIYDTIEEKLEALEDTIRNLIVKTIYYTKWKLEYILNNINPVQLHYLNYEFKQIRTEKIYDYIAGFNGNTEYAKAVKGTKII